MWTPDIYSLVPLERIPIFLSIGNAGHWLETVPAFERDMPSAKTRINSDLLEKMSPVGRNFILNIKRTHPDPALAVAYTEILGRLIADGPKVFSPTDEQFESMENVEMKVPLKMFSSPYPVLVIAIPPASRKRISEDLGISVNLVPSFAVIRWESQTGLAHVVIPLPATGMEDHYVFIPHEGDTRVVEDIVNTHIEDTNGKKEKRHLEQYHGSLATEKKMVIRIVRAVFNLAHMLTHFGHRVSPVDPVAYDKHRRKEKLQHLAHGDWLAVNMTQNIVLRAPSPHSMNPQGIGTGTECRPHWRKGFWRAYPGQGAARAAGETVPLLFVRPCLVRGDRVKGDVSESMVTIKG